MLWSFNHRTQFWICVWVSSHVDTYLSFLQYMEASYYLIYLCKQISLHVRVPEILKFLQSIIEPPPYFTVSITIFLCSFSKSAKIFRNYHLGSFSKFFNTTGNDRLIGLRKAELLFFLLFHFNQCLNNYNKHKLLYL